MEVSWARPVGGHRVPIGALCPRVPVAVEDAAALDRSPGDVPLGVRDGPGHEHDRHDRDGSRDDPGADPLVPLLPTSEGLEACERGAAGVSRGEVVDLVAEPLAGATTAPVERHGPTTSSSTRSRRASVLRAS